MPTGGDEPVKAARKEAERRDEERTHGRVVMSAREWKFAGKDSACHSTGARRSTGRSGAAWLQQSNARSAIYKCLRQNRACRCHDHRQARRRRHFLHWTHVYQSAMCGGERSLLLRVDAWANWCDRIALDVVVVDL